MFGFTTAAIMYIFYCFFSFEQSRPRTFKKCLGGTESIEESMSVFGGEGISKYDI